MKTIAALLLLSVLVGCQTAASPPIVVEKNVTVLVIGGHAEVLTEYWSETAAQMRDLGQHQEGEADIDVPLLP